MSIIRPDLFDPPHIGNPNRVAPNRFYMSAEGLNQGQIPDVSGWRANEPANMLSNSQSFKPFDTIGDNWPTVGGSAIGELQLVASDSEYAFNAKAGRSVLFAGSDDGFAPTTLGFNPPNSPKELYFCMPFKVSSNWQNNSSGVNKILFITTSNYGGGGDPLVLKYNSGPFDPPEINFAQQGTGVTLKSLSPNLANVPVPEGTEALFEAYLVMNDNGFLNGECHFWVNGIKTGEHTDVEYINVDGGWDSFRWEPTWGGNNGDVTIAEQYQEIAAIYVSWR